MGYESTLLVVRAPMRNRDGELTNVYEGAAYCELIAHVDLSKTGYQSRTAHVISEAIVIEKARRSVEDWAYSFYDINDGNTQVTEDRYGDPLAPVPLDALIEAMEQDEKDESYRRYALALSLLRAARDDAESWGTEGLVVLHFGH